MKVFKLVLLCILFWSSKLFACSVFADRINGQELMIGKNFDWHSKDGFLIKNPRGMTRQGLSDKSITWTSRYSSMSFNSIGPGFPISGMNEQGLVVETLVNGSESSAAIIADSLISLEALQMILDLAKTVDEAKAILDSHGLSQVIIPLHFMVCDKSGGCIAIETKDQKLMIQDLKKPYKVLANRYLSQDEASFRQQHKGSLVASLARSSSYRYGTLAKLSKQQDPKSIDQVFDWLDQARIPTLIKWQIVWLPGRGEFTWRVYDSPLKKSPKVTFSIPHALDCTLDSSVLRIGSAREEFSPFTEKDQEASRKNLKKVMMLRAPGTSTQMLDAIIKHTTTGTCQKS
ncbi:MAG: linear amide C-N hydrolase [Pseudobacteriovorax sp.]|nr:linear amide C-N hydrolase [Pseudobacteriovorax sp.]